MTAFTGLWLNRRKELLLIIASEWGLAILGCPRDSGFYSCENISSRFLSICYPFCIIEVGPRSLSIEIGWKKISFICLFELDILLSNSPPFSSLIQMSSPHFELFSSKIPDPQVPSVVAFCRFKNCHCWVLIVLVVSLSGLISTSSTDSQLPFDFLTCPEVFPVYWSLFLWGIWQSHNVSLEIITQYDHDIQDQTESRNSLWNHLLGMENAHL